MLTRDGTQRMGELIPGRVRDKFILNATKKKRCHIYKLTENYVILDMRQKKTLNSGHNSSADFSTEFSILKNNYIFEKKQMVFNLGQYNTGKRIFCSSYNRLNLGTSNSYLKKHLCIGCVKSPQKL